MAKSTARACLDCGTDITGCHHNRKRCVPCADARAQEWNREYQKAYYLENKERIGERLRVNAEAIKLRKREYRAEHYQANRERYAERKKAYRENNPELVAKQASVYYQANRDKILERGRKYEEANREKLRDARRKWYEINGKERGRAYYAANRESLREYQAEYYQANRERCRSYSRRSGAARRARMADAGIIPFTEEQLQAKIAYWGDRCWMCGTDDWADIDHIKPIAKGGAHMLSNLRPICKRCNGSKWIAWPLTNPLGTHQHIAQKVHGGNDFGDQR